ncbi:MAG TPA: hypothetical protein VF627_09670, partial [Abditibacterium sp.]
MEPSQPPLSPRARFWAALFLLVFASSGWAAPAVPVAPAAEHGSTLVNLLVVAVLVLANGFFVASEFALVAVRRTRIDQLA